MANPNPDGCCGFQTTCCENRKLPDRLFATISGGSGCGCIPSTIGLVIDPSQGTSLGAQWNSKQYSMEGCGADPSSFIEFSLECGENGTFSMGFSGCESDSDVNVEPTSCDPLSISFSLTVFQPNQCGDCSGQLSVTVTE